MRFIFAPVWLLTGSGILFAAVSYAAEPAAGPWSGKAALGVLATSGNSDTTNANLSLGLKYDRDRWHHEAAAVASGADNQGTTTAERYKLGYKAKHDFGEHSYLFGLINYEKDKFSGYDQQISEAVGYGRRLINNQNHVLNLEAGAGMKQSDLRDGTSSNEAILRLGSDYVWTFSPTGEFSQVVGIESGADNTYLEWVSAVKAALAGDLALVLSYTVKSNSDVPVGSEKTDTFTAISLEYGF